MIPTPKMRFAWPRFSLVAALVSVPFLPLAAQGLTKDQIILQALQNERDEGFNTHLAAPGGLYINWVYTSTPPPTLLNLNSAGVPDADPTTRHDRLTDLVYLADLALYKRLHPTDTQFDADITRYTTILQSTSGDNFLNSPDQRGWVYWAFKDIIAQIPSFAGYEHAMADKYYSLYQSHLTTYGAAMPVYFSTPADEATSTYRVDSLIENAAVLICDGKERNLPSYVSAGEALMSYALANGYSTSLTMWAAQMGHIFTDSTRTVLADPATQYVYGTNIDSGQIAEICEALCLAEQVDPGHGYGSKAITTLNKLVPTTNTYGFWDSTHSVGGYYSSLLFSAHGAGVGIHDTTLTVSPNTAYKQVGRAATMMRAFLAANAFAGANYSSSTLNAIDATNQASYYAAGHGWPFQEANDYSLYTANIGGHVVTQNWVTSEAIGHAVRALISTETSGQSSLTDADIGSVGLAGSASYSNGTWTVKGSGGDIYNTADQFNFASQSISGNCTIIARVVTEQNTNTHAKVGVMIRESSAANSTYVDVVACPTTATGLRMENRTTTGGSAANIKTTTGITVPYWVKLVRSGNTFTGSISPNGTTWTQLGTTTISMASNVLIGLAVCAHDNTQLNTSTLDSLSITTP